MTDILIVDGRAYSWKRLCELRRTQLEAARKARGGQAVLFELRDDCRPGSECTAAYRLTEPSLFESQRQ